LLLRAEEGEDGDDDDDDDDEGDEGDGACAPTDANLAVRDSILAASISSAVVGIAAVVVSLAEVPLPCVVVDSVCVGSSVVLEAESEGSASFAPTPKSCPSTSSFLSSNAHVKHCKASSLHSFALERWEEAVVEPLGPAALRDFSAALLFECKKRMNEARM
jgi:hypothetical protein